MRGKLRRESGSMSILIAIAFMALSIPLVTGALGLSSGLSVDSRIKTDIVQSDYCALAIAEYVRYLGLSQTRWTAWWSAPGREISAPGANPVVGEEVLTIGGCNAISFRLQLSSAPGSPPALGAPQLETTKSISSPTASPGAVLEYSIVVANPADSLRAEDLTAIYDGLPLGFTYEMETTRLNGQPFGDPTQTLPGQDDDQFCIFAVNDTLTIPQGDIIPCSIGADGNVKVRNNAHIGGNVKSVDGNVDIDQGATVTGDIRAGGNVTLGQGVTVGGSIRAEGNVTLGQGATVQGHIRAGTGDVTLGQGDNVMGDVVSMTGNVDIGQGADTAGDIWAGGNVDLRQGVGVDRNVWSLGNVTLKNDAGVGTDQYPGVVIAGGNVTLGQGATVAGGYTDNCQAPLCTVPPVPSWALFDGTGDRLLLTWDLTSAGVTLDPGDSATLTFEVKVSNEGANYCNQAWADPGGTATSSGLTAKAAVGNPSGSLCEGEAVLLKTTVDPNLAASGTQPTVTYTTTIQNTGDTNLNISMVRNKLPPGFSYVAGSSKYQSQPGGTQFTAVDPAPVFSGGRWRLTWYPQPFASAVLGPGGTKTLTFQARADLDLVKGNYRTETWAFFSEYDSAQTPYTWPTALVQVLDPYVGTATDSSGDELGSYQAWLGTDTNNFSWTIR